MYPVSKVITMATHVPTDMFRCSRDQKMHVHFFICENTNYICTCTIPQLSIMEWPIKEGDTFLTTPTAKQVLKAAVEAVLVPFSPELERKMELVKMIDKEKHWYIGFYSIVDCFVTLMAHLPPVEALLMAQTGLDTLRKEMLFRKDDNTVVPAHEAFSQDDIHVSWDTKILHGFWKPNKLNYLFPLVSLKGRTLYKKDALLQLLAWMNYGCLEPSAAIHARQTCLSGNVDISKQVFVLLGATSELGPAKILLKIPHAHVLAVARPGRKLNSLAEWFARFCPTNSTLVLPGDGADLLTEGPQIAKWIIDTVPQDKQVVICHLAYVDGEAHVRVNVAMDLISKYVSERHPNVALSFLSSPATVMVVPPEAAAACKTQSKERWHSYARSMSSGRWMKGWQYDKGITGMLPAVLNGMTHSQDPNFALAKMMQQWRCMVAYSQKQIVSAPMAPATRTQSVVSQSDSAFFLEGMQFIEPLVAFNVNTTSSLMTAILLSQINLPPLKLDHPMHVVWDGSVHGGVWRCPYLPESVHHVSYLLGLVTPKGYIPKGSLPTSENLWEQKFQNSKDLPGNLLHHSKAIKKQ